MPNLPTISVTDEQANRLIAIFGTTDEYKAWLKQALRDHVLGIERLRVTREEDLRKQGEIDRIDQELFGP